MSVVSPSTSASSLEAAPGPAGARRFPVSRLRGPNNEGVLALVIVVLALVVGFVTPSFWSAGTLVNLAGSSISTLVFALGVLLVLLSGGIDVSFLAIGAFAAYTTVQAVATSGLGSASVVIPFLIAAGIGLLLGLLNAAAIVGLKIPTLIATLGTQGIVRGVLITYIGSRVISELPAATASLSTSYLLVAEGPTRTPLSVLFVPVVVIAALVAALLRSTVFGRGVYAIGGHAEFARRAGFPVMRIQVGVYMLAGVLAGLGGMVHVILVREANPFTLVGGELDVIAAVVLGGASIFGGRGSVLGTVLGVVLISLINNSLLLLGVPSFWQRAAVGLMLLIGVSAQAWRGRKRRPALEDLPEATEFSGSRGSDGRRGSGNGLSEGRLA
ncbi:ABC transporter permease [Georgenia thermotolerans]|uniref:ABC transporter permease n=1 Tax=Georgenia thermotolerans TaxID=527326 RepID=A0A7J5UUJ9_9MICO|nr:ABC transporter permease [Georgenia thermotolerans]KAE8765940.1 ABC transporter permease [Georgenia thermotolerans]